MSVPSSIELLYRLSKSVDSVNNQMIDHMTESDMNYQWACIKPDLTYGYFEKELKKQWESEVNQFLNSSTACQSTVLKLMGQAGTVISLVSEAGQVDTSKMTSTDIENMLLDQLTTYLMETELYGQFVFKPKLIDSLVQLFHALKVPIYCQAYDIFQYVLSKSHENYRKKFLTIKLPDSQKKLPEEERKKALHEAGRKMLQADFDNFKSVFKTTTTAELKETHQNLIADVSSKLTGLYGFSVESELEKLIPNELGSLKQFFIKVISTYFNELHPIIWSQIIKQIINDFFLEIPVTPEQIFQFASKRLLLNSGPFILKILQMIRPVLTPELATKYNLTKLTYPQLLPNQIQIILKKVVPDWSMVNILLSVSASVGHVCIVHRADKPLDRYVIKIIKPVSIAQSCWEYKTLYNIFNQDSCENDFVQKMLESNGREGDGSTCAYAAKNGHLEVLKWARENGCEWDSSTCAWAAEHGHLEVLKWARENGCPWDSLTCARAAEHGHLEVLKWAHENNCPCDDDKHISMIQNM